MNDASAFEAERSRLTAVATRILGSWTEADDVMQEAWLRLSGTEGVEDLSAWLTTVVTRLCLDHLRKRGTGAGATTPAAESVLASPAGPGIDPEADALLAERVGEALQVVVDALSPVERVALVLHDVFGYRFEEIGAALGRSVPAVRQLASRARRKVQDSPEPAHERAARIAGRHVVQAFLDAAHGGDLTALLSLIAPDAVMSADGHAQKLGTQSRYDGPDAVAARFNGSRGALPVSIDGEPGAAWIHRGRVTVVFVFHVRAGLVGEIELIADPEVLAGLIVTRTTRRIRP